MIMKTVKTDIGLLPGLVAVMSLVAAFSQIGCGWGVDGLDRMDKLYPPDVPDVSGEVIVTDIIEDNVQTDVVTDLPVENDGVIVDDTIWPDVSYVGLDGKWAARLVSNGIMTVPMVGERPMATTDLFIAEKTTDGLSLTFCDELIDVEPTADFNTTTTTKPALRDAIAEVPVIVATNGDTVSVQEIVWTWALAGTIGADDPFPTDVNLDNYPDIDSDTNPGVTIAVSLVLWDAPTTGERYMAKRVKFSLDEGTMSEDGRWITGAMTFEVEEKVLGANQPLLNNGAAVAPGTEGTGYQFRRVDDAFDCATLVADHKALFRTAP
jgi:hypothetical protein